MSCRKKNTEGNSGGGPSGKQRWWRGLVVGNPHKRSNVKGRRECTMKLYEH